MSNINWVKGCWVTTVFLVNDQLEVLLTWNKNLQKWIPVGGHIDPGETPEEAVIREVIEETGFDFEFVPENRVEQSGQIKVINPLRVQIEKVPHHGFHINHIFVGKCTRYSERASTDEEETLRWFNRHYLLNHEEEFLDSVWKNSLKAIEIVSKELCPE